MKTKALRKDAPQVVQVIYTETERRGAGLQFDPVRKVKQVFTLDGQLMLEHDPYGTLTVKEVMQVLRHNLAVDLMKVEQLLMAYMENKTSQPF